jgi:hypothetical protein
VEFSLEEEGAGAREGAGDVYWIEAVKVVRGTASPAPDAGPGARVVRREVVAAEPPAAWSAELRGGIEHALSTSDEEQRELHGRWSKSPWRVAVLVAFAHVPAWWGLPDDQRRLTHLAWGPSPKGGRRGGTAVLDRVLRRLYRAPGPQARWDVLAYFEMQPEDVAHVRDLLAEVRDLRANPGWGLVEREAELWMIKEL